MLWLGFNDIPLNSRAPNPASKDRFLFYAKVHLPKHPSRKLYSDLILAELAPRWAPNGLINGF